MTACTTIPPILPMRLLLLLYTPLPHSYKLTYVMKVTQQTNGSDCGVLAIAFAYNLYSGQNLCNVRYDRQLIRQGCLEGCRFSRFPRSCNGIVTCPVSRTRTVYLCSECYALACRIDVHCLCFL